MGDTRLCSAHRDFETYQCVLLSRPESKYSKLRMAKTRHFVSISVRIVRMYGGGSPEVALMTIKLLADLEIKKEAAKTLAGISA